MERSAILAAAIILGGFAFPRAAVAAAVINEVLFDPVGSDTGAEKIELYNPDAAAVDLSGWELYPDGIGYFVFPAGTSLSAKSFLTVHLRASGFNDAGNLYHAAPTGNMGNSSGSIALFSSGARGAETIVDFMRYHKPGSAERKTWESAAEAAGLWASGAFIDVASLAEGSSIGLASDGARGPAAAWKAYGSPSMGAPNAAGATAPPPAPPPPASEPGAEAPGAASAPPPRPALGAQAGADVSAVAGAAVLFRGTAFGLDGEALAGVRFLWNFGDGATGEGKSLSHIYHFPGQYRANLSVSSGEYAGSDWLIVTVLPPRLAVSEAAPGANGFVEIHNGSDTAVDLTGLFLADGAGGVFRIPGETVIAAGGALPIANAVSGLDPAASVSLRDARNMLLDSAAFPSRAPLGASWERVGRGFVLSGEPTPGRHDEPAIPESQPSAPVTAPRAPAPVASAPVASPAAVNLPAPQMVLEAANAAPAAESPPEPREAIAAAGAGFFPRLFLAAALVMSAVAAAAIIILKRRAFGGGNI